MNKQILVELISEAKRIEEDAIYSAKSQFEASSWWKNVNLWIGIPTAIMSAIAGFSALSEYSYILAGVLAILATALTALSTFLNPNQKSNTHLNAGNNYLALRNRARIYKNVDCKVEKDIEILAQGLHQLANERDNLNKNSPQVSREHFEAARRGIKEGEASYKVDTKS